MKTKLVFAGAFFTAWSLLAQTNSLVSVCVEVPSITIKFPSTMTPSEIGKVLERFYGTNLTFAFMVTNNQTHEQLKFKGNSIPSKDELQRLFSAQRQYALPNDFIWDLTPGEHQYKVTDNLTGKTYSLTGKGGPPTQDELTKLIGQQTNEVVSGQSDTLTAFRRKFPQFANVSDSQVVLTI